MRRYLERRNLVIELDHPETHGSAYQQRIDASRDARHKARGREVARIEEGDLKALADAIAEQLRNVA